MRRVGGMRRGTLLGELSRLRCVVVHNGRAAGGLGLGWCSHAPTILPPAAAQGGRAENIGCRKGGRRALSSSSVAAPPSPLRASRYCDVRSRAFSRGETGGLKNKGFQENDKKKASGGRRRRLDEVCREFYPQHSRNLLQSWIMQGKVKVDGRVVTKSGHLVPRGSKVLVEASEPKYVCRAGLKMEAALERFEVAVAGRVALDAGLSTGGFTDCLLQNGAARVYGVDVGYGQVAEKVRVDPRVVVMERTNVRHLTAEDLPEKVQIATLDLSFISILKVMGAVCQVLEPGGDLITLIKPQFEADRDEISRGGLVRSGETHERVTRVVTEGIEKCGFEFQQLIESPITGAQSGNKEFLAHFVYKGEQ